MDIDDVCFNKESFIEHFMSNVSKAPDRKAIIEADSEKSITYKELDILSGKVYRFLTDFGIGKEDVVMIYLPRGIAPLVVYIGAWKAGAAVVLLEINDYFEKNKEYIYQDCRCKLLIDQKTFNAIMQTESKIGYEQTDLHDLAYIVYTSGTTGRPKGAVQEFGTVNLYTSSLCVNGESLLHEGDVGAMVTPMNFVASSMTLQAVFYYGLTLMLSPLSYVKNPHLLAEKFRKCHVETLFMTPSFFKIFDEQYSEYKMIFLSAEPIRDIYKEDAVCVSFYSQSEAGYFVTLFKLDRACEASPLGKNPLNEKLTFVVDEQGNVLQGEGFGELCYWNPFFRGYVGQEKLTKSVTDGTIVHSGDMVKQTADGTLFYQCRKDDMVKIHGNRVEPFEIEKSLKKVLGVEWAAIRVFVDNDKSILCAYYTGEPKITIEEAKDLLRKNLADYMVPGIFIHMDEIPLNSNGKFSRSLLPYPSLRQPNRKYKAPSTKTEQEICCAMAKVLGTETVGSTDDFYEMGGDSLRSIRLIMELAWDQLDASMIFQGRTPEAIAKLYEKAIDHHTNRDVYVQNEKAPQKDYPLLLEQQYMFDYQQHVPISTTWNLSYLLSFSKAADIRRVQDAVQKTLRNHPVFSLIYCYNETNKLVQRYVKETDLSVEIEKTTEQAFTDIVKTLVQPFELLNSPLYRIRLFETEEKGYLFLDMHHSIVDGSSMHILADDIQRAYAGQSLKEDFYFRNLEERMAQTASPLYEEGRAYYAQKLDQYQWESYPTIDENTSDYKYSCLEAFVPIVPQKYDAIYKAYGLSKNAFYIAVTLLAISSYNQKNNVKISWVFHGREKNIEQHIVGTLLKEFYVGIHIEKQTTMKAFFDEILNQIRMSMKYSCYPYPGIERMDAEGEDTSLIYQYDLLAFNSKGKLPFAVEELPIPRTVADNLLDIEIRESEGSCKLFMEYNGARYREESMHRFRDMMIRTALLLMEKMDNPQCKLSEILE